MNEFTVVSYKSKKNRSRASSKNITESQIVGPENTTSLPLEQVIRNIILAKEDLENSLFFEDIISNLNQFSHHSPSTDLVSYGLGQFSHCVTSRYQFAFLLKLKDIFKAELSVYDPAFTDQEKQILKEFDCILIDCNEEGKRLAERNTVFFLPHCPKQLINNLLWKNWNSNLTKCIIIGNSLAQIIESNPSRFLKENLYFVFHASTIVNEVRVENTFKYSDIFNDLSIHSFPENVNTSDIFSEPIEEPTYKQEDIEFITSH